MKIYQISIIYSKKLFLLQYLFINILIIYNTQNLGLFSSLLIIFFFIKKYFIINKNLNI